MQKYVVFVKDDLLNRAHSGIVVANTEKSAIEQTLAQQYGRELAHLFSGFRLNVALEHFNKLGIFINASSA